MLILNILGTTEYSRHATKVALGVAIAFTVIGFAKFAFGYNSIGPIHVLKYFILFSGLYIGARTLVNNKEITNQLEVILFGIKTSLRTALFYTLISSFFIMVFQSADNMDTFLKGTPMEVFLVNILVTFWGCLILGALFSYIISVMLPTDNK
ncbi:MAG: hypothetical protein ACJA1A_002605 [Saprospiraceae bacterium]|jgi:hypothetical protein|tara:strand:- start:709 stop:1164 length:456 start_codon:yes stop_codon:yes gene_type:complete